MSQENYTPPQDPETFDYLHDLGVTDPVFGQPGELDTRSHAEELRAGLLAVAQAAHDQVIGRAEPRHMSMTGEQVDVVSGKTYVHDEVTNTSYRIITSDLVEGDMKLRITSATAHHRHAQPPEFFKRHDLNLTYHQDGTVDDPVVFQKRFKGLTSTVAFDAKDPSAFLAMADSINRSHEITEWAFKRQDRRSEHEYVTGQIGQLGILRGLVGMEPQGVPFDHGDNVQGYVEDK